MAPRQKSNQTKADVLLPRTSLVMLLRTASKETNVIAVIGATLLLLLLMSLLLLFSNYPLLLSADAYFTLLFKQTVR